MSFRITSREKDFSSRKNIGVQCSTRNFSQEKRNSLSLSRTCTRHRLTNNETNIRSKMVYTSFRIVEGGITLAQTMLIHTVFTLSHKLKQVSQHCSANVHSPWNRENFIDRRGGKETGSSLVLRSHSNFVQTSYKSRKQKISSAGGIQVWYLFVSRVSVGGWIFSSKKKFLFLNQINRNHVFLQKGQIH